MLCHITYITVMINKKTEWHKLEEHFLVFSRYPKMITAFIVQISKRTPQFCILVVQCVFVHVICVVAVVCRLRRTVFSTGLTNRHMVSPTAIDRAIPACKRNGIQGYLPPSSNSKNGYETWFACGTRSTCNGRFRTWVRSNGCAAKRFPLCSARARSAATIIHNSGCALDPNLPTGVPATWCIFALRTSRSREC